MKRKSLFWMVLSDACLFLLSLTLAYLLRSDFVLERAIFYEIVALAGFMVPLKVLVFYAFGLYEGMWRYVSVRELWSLVGASLISTMIIMVVLVIAVRFQGFARAVFLLDSFLTILLTGGLRFAIRTLHGIESPYTYVRNICSWKGLSRPFPSTQRKVMIIGAGKAGEKILREIQENAALEYCVKGFVDDDPSKTGRSIHGVKVLGGMPDLPLLLERHGITEVLIAIPSAPGEKIREVVELCKQSRVEFKILPGIGELINGSVSLKELRDVKYEDLLGRVPVRLDIADIKRYLTDQVILITGSGGSIGSELCRQLLPFQPRQLILLDACERNLYDIQMELQHDFNFDNHQAVLCRIQDRPLMDAIFQRYRPNVVFHAAAYKHVPMLEKNPWEAVFNNIVGSRVTMEVAIRHQVERFVLVSTDKAVRPTNVMGASKRITELLMQACSRSATRFMAVRFGNVIGSSGSVVPLFRHQIEQGGPVTVTHPEITRYFMTIPEAAQLIIQAGAMGEGGEIFILKMGQPVRIADMAVDLIRLSGKEPGKDIRIVFTGLREGDKLYEELITEGEGIIDTPHDKIMVLRNDLIPHVFKTHGDLQRHLDHLLESLYAAAERHDGRSIRRSLHKIIPEYIPQDSETIF